MAATVAAGPAAPADPPELRLGATDRRLGKAAPSGGRARRLGIRRRPVGRVPPMEAPTEGSVEYARATDVLADLGPYVCVATDATWARTGFDDALPPPARRLVPESLEELTLDRLIEADGSAPT